MTTACTRANCWSKSILDDFRWRPTTPGLSWIWHRPSRLGPAGLCRGACGDSRKQAANFKAQRDARRYAVLFAQQVVSQEQYDQYDAIAKVDAANTDALREAARATSRRSRRVRPGRRARAELDQALLNLSTRGSMRRRWHRGQAPGSTRFAHRAGPDFDVYY